MNCNDCGFTHPDNFPVCPVCGEWTIRAVPALPAPDKRTARAPYFLLLGMLLVGIVLFLLIPMGREAPAAPSEVPPESSSSQLFQKDCFILEDGILSFDESQFLSGPILIVPAAIEGEPVLEISAGCFENLQGVTTIVLPSSVTGIGERAFAGCTALRGLCIPNAVINIGREAFLGCNNLEAVYIPTYLSSLGDNAFGNCPRLQFIFYNGLYEEWIKICPDVITPFTWVICWDGEYRHIGKTP